MDKFLRMIKLNSGLIFSLLLLIGMTSCDKDDPGPEKRTSVFASETAGAFYYANIAVPDTFLNDNIHSTEFAYDLDGEGSDDIILVAEMDTIKDGSNNPTHATKKLSLIVAGSSNKDVFVSKNGDDVQIYGKGLNITRQNTNWRPLDDTEVVLAYTMQDLSSGQVTTDGVWNGTNRQYMGFLLQEQGVDELICWFEISVISVDNFAYFNHAAFQLD